MERTLYRELLAWKADKGAKPLLLSGARQVGKTYLARQFCTREYARALEVNLFDYPNVVALYDTALTSAEKFEQLKLILNTDLDGEAFLQDGILFIDEVQESESLLTELKYLREHKPRLRILCSGSLLGVKLRRLSKALPVGQVDMLKLRPLSFEEFLLNTDNAMLRDAVADCFGRDKALSAPVHERALNVYRSYLCLGGMPEVVNSYLEAGIDLAGVDRRVAANIMAAYLDDMNKYVRNHAESNRIAGIYNSLPSQMLNASRKFQYSKVDRSARAKTHASALDWLVAADMVLLSRAATWAEVPLRANTDSDVFKLFFGDIGFLVSLTGLDFADIMTNQSFGFKGALAENYVACELAAVGRDLYYWRSEHSAEVDFLLENGIAQGGILPVEVKADKHVQTPSLSVYRRRFDPSCSLRVSAKNFGFENGIKSVPLYAVFCLGRR
ncbi:MAG: ATP-binding protein [Coriobacteriales bacterium]|jgi:predicted AAA+ superfamily ATPase|nr:ATP-binding protein [Coriobacteriales bacterium]